MCVFFFVTQLFKLSNVNSVCIYEVSDTSKEVSFLEKSFDCFNIFVQQPLNQYIGYSFSSNCVSFWNRICIQGESLFNLETRQIATLFTSLLRNGKMILLIKVMF